MSTLTISAPTILECGACGGTLVPSYVTGTYAQCAGCLGLFAEHDITLDDGERLVWVDDVGHVGNVFALAYFTEYDDDSDD